jgi:hypothetical protein
MYSFGYKIMQSFLLVKVPFTPGHPEVLASRKVVYCKVSQKICEGIEREIFG